VKATVEIVATDSGSRVVASVLQEKDGWLNLGTYGFTYSTPLIKVKLSQEKPAVVTPSPTPSPTQSSTSATTTQQVKKMASIKCVKGKKSIKPTKGKCPKGSKKSS